LLPPRCASHLASLHFASLVQFGSIPGASTNNPAEKMLDQSNLSHDL
jgi:hypothetical protein